MRIHIQIPEGEELFAVTPAQWQAALARHPDEPHHQVSFASDDAGFAAAIGEAEVLLSWTKVIKARFTPGVLPGLAPKLRIIACTSAGLDRLQPFDWLPPSVALINNRGTHARKAGEFAIMALLMLGSRMPEIIDNQRAARWDSIFSNALAGRTVGIVGLGTIGGEAARHAKSFGMTVIGIRNGEAPHPHCDETHQVAALDALLPRLDFLLLCCPLTPATRGLIDARRLRLLPKGAKLVNMARGLVWDQEAVCDALDDGHLEGVVTDVAWPEPLPPESRLWRTQRLVVVPHVSSDDPATYNDRTLDILFANLAAFRDGRALPNRVWPERGY